MDIDSEDELPKAPSIDQPFDAEEAAVILELTERQKKFADAVLAGCNFTRAAELAGYGGTGASLRSSASAVAKSAKVVAYLDWARNGRTGLPTQPASIEEVERKLAEHLRGSDKNASIRASELLTRLHSVRAEAARDRAPDPIESLNKLAALSEFGLLTAMALAKANGIDWTPPEPPAPDAEARQVAQLKATLTPEDRRRAEYITARQNSHPTRGPEPEGQAAPPSQAPDGGAAVGFVTDRRVAAMAFRNSKL